jgi:hypothetical protein
MTPLAIAHEALKGDLSNTFGGLSKDDSHLFKALDNGHYITSYYLACGDRCHGSNYERISTVEEFNNFKGECMKTLVNTTEDNGKLYQIGCFYEFKDAIGKFWEVGVLCDYEEGKFKSKCGNKLEWYDSIKKCTGIMGAVVDAPVKLENGKAYQFEVRGNVFHGIYEKRSASFNVMAGQFFNDISCTNIKPLTVEGK